MKRPTRQWLLGLTIALLPALALIQAQERGVGRESESSDGELQRVLRDHFGRRLKVELSLSEDQVSVILPRLERLEQARTDARIENSRGLKRLRQAFDAGEDDARLAELLDELERADHEFREFERKTLREVDLGLSVRQRVQIRLFMQHFGREHQEQARRLRRDLDGPARRARRGESRQGSSNQQ